MRKKKDGRVIIIHGTKGSSEGNWFPWLAGKLSERGVTVLVPAFPTPDRQNLENWLVAFHDKVGSLQKGDCLIGHSLGVAFALRLLESSAVKIRGAFFVAGFTGGLGIPEYDNLNRSFVRDEFLWESIRAHCGKFFVYAGDNDPYVPLFAVKEVAENLGVAPTIIKGGGHLNAESGFMEFPRLLEDVSEVL